MKKFKALTRWVFVTVVVTTVASYGLADSDTDFGSFLGKFQQGGSSDYMVLPISGRPPESRPPENNNNDNAQREQQQEQQQQAQREQEQQQQEEAQREQQQQQAEAQREQQQQEQQAEAQRAQQQADAQRAQQQADAQRQQQQAEAQRQQQQQADAQRQQQQQADAQRQQQQADAQRQQQQADAQRQQQQADAQRQQQQADAQRAQQQADAQRAQQQADAQRAQQQADAQRQQQQQADAQRAQQQADAQRQQQQQADAQRQQQQADAQRQQQQADAQRQQQQAEAQRQQQQADAQRQQQQQQHGNSHGTTTNNNNVAHNPDSNRAQADSQVAQQQAQQQHQQEQQKVQTRQNSAQAQQLRTRSQDQKVVSTNPAMLKSAAATQQIQQFKQSKLTTMKQADKTKPAVPAYHPSTQTNFTQKAGHMVGIQPNHPVQRVNVPARSAVVVNGKTAPSYLGNSGIVRGMGLAKKNAGVERSAHVTVYNGAVRTGRTYVANFGRGNQDVFKRWYHYRNDDDYYRFYYSAWFSLGFYGGYYYPVDLCDWTADDYFWYPSVYWFYSDDYNPDLYSAWYGDYYYLYPVAPFRFARVYYPSQAFIDMNVEVSSWQNYQQSNFRTEILNLTQDLAQQISNNLQESFVLSPNDIVVTNYNDYNDGQGNEALVFNGAVDRGNLHIGFEALLNPNDPTDYIVFVPVGQEPTDADQYNLNLINQRIQSLGGDPTVVYTEPEPQLN